MPADRGGVDLRAALARLCALAMCIGVAGACLPPNVPNHVDDTRDAGNSGEGEGEVNCPDMTVVATLVDDAGVPHYENCPEPHAVFYQNDCTFGECASNDRQRAVLEAVLGVAEERGYEVQVSELEGEGSQVGVKGVVVVDWVQARIWLSVDFDPAGDLEIEELRERMPVSIPVSVLPLEGAIAQLHRCQPEALPDICTMDANAPWLAGFPADMCGAAGVEIWNSLWPDAGTDPLVYCQPTTPCCTVDAGPVDADGGGDPPDAGPGALDAGGDPSDAGPGDLDAGSDPPDGG